MNCKDHTPLDLPQQITANKINKIMTKGNYHGSLKKTLQNVHSSIWILKTTNNSNRNGHLKSIKRLCIKEEQTKCDSCSVVMFFNQCSIVT